MVQVQIAYEGQLRCRATHGPSGATLVTDAPVDNQGRGSSFSPTDLVATALGTCTLTIMGILAQRHGWDLAGVQVRVQKEMVSQPHRRIGRLRVEIQLPPDLNAEQRHRLEQAAHTCPVAKSLHPDVAVELVLSPPPPEAPPEAPPGTLAV